VKRSAQSAPAPGKSAPAGAAQTFGLPEVERMLGLSRSAILGVVRSGLVKPGRGGRGAYLFSFPDLILLRTARALAAAKISPRRIARSLRRLREQLPEQLPLSGLRILADGEDVVVQDGQQRWRADTGQYLLAFETGPALTAPASPGSPAEAGDWFERANRLEATDPESAISAYRRALRMDAGNEAARVNLGRVLHERGRLREAEQLYRSGLAAGARHALLHFNLAVLLEDLDRGEEAIDAYRSALREDPRLADAHYNLSLVYEKLGKPQLALKHLREYRRLNTRS
jgi:tetratricopeptide (TPR) repeat protein